ncbi:DUF3871 family protein [Flavobacterium tibetense]|uniref:DUF3871 family protein n=1 Tax=Flavobacterium tibetense TaxID=2233533 RepID=A0A365P3F1_9FLAO|nr:DUF3871 family protein [Flavobacterium tibetense]RBA29081.1 hypothetical protein DPN68_04800 [Flavobacterium tibetense]
MEMELTLAPANNSITILERLVEKKAPTFLEVKQPLVLPKLPFIEANTENVSLSHLKENCIIPVFTKDNEITISHQQFIETVLEAVSQVFGNETIESPEIRTSHLIRGRTPDALHVPAKELLDHQKTMYYERMAFCIKIPSIAQDVGGNRLELTIGGVRAYNQENLYNKKTYEKFKFFIGFKNMVCCNLCISTDGYQSEIKAISNYDLLEKVKLTIQQYKMEEHVATLKNLNNFQLSEREFAQIIGKSKLYNYLPKNEKAHIPELLLNDGHINAVAKDYYNDESFCRDTNGDINLWKFYNLLTGSNKSSYIDTFLSRGVNAFDFSKGISKALSDGDSNYAWFLS